MGLSSPKVSFDNRLLAIEEQFRQRKFTVAVKEIRLVSETDFISSPHELGLYLSLSADSFYHQGNYKQAIENGLKSARILADFTLNRRYGRVQLILSKSYLAVGDVKNAEMRARDALASFRRASDPLGQISSLNELARVAYIRCSYNDSISFLEEALTMVDDNPRKYAQLTGNIGTLLVHIGQWDKAEEILKNALKENKKLGFENAMVVNLLSLGFVNLKKRKFVQSTRHLEAALSIAERLDLKRDKVIALKYNAELSFEKGDIFKAKSLASNAYHSGLLLAPDSALVSQAARRLADVELALDNMDGAMKYAQKALDISMALSEQTEVGLARRVIAQVFSARGEFDDALENIQQAIETLREVGDPFELARSLLVLTDIGIKSESLDKRVIRSAFEEAYRLLKKLKCDYWIAETEFKAGIFACQEGDLSTGFKKLSRAEKRFVNAEEKTKIKAVHNFLQSLSEQAVALSVSQENMFKIFGNMIGSHEISDLKASRVEDILSILLKKTGGDRALIYTPTYENESVIATLPLSSHQMKKFGESFNSLLGEEISNKKPTLNLDCRRDPFINNLLADIPEVVASMIVVPFKMTDGTLSYLYIDCLTTDGTLKPFDQNVLNFVVGFTDLIAFRWAEIIKNKLLEDNRRLRNQLQENASFPNIITQNEKMLEMLAHVHQVVNSNISVSIEGDTGTGKDLLARAIHYNSLRRDKRFISVNCAALPETLLESELFGYQKGAFTGADHNKPGLIEEADGGTFFLDEIADMPLSIQAKILRVLETKEIVRLGETNPRTVDVRIVSATNKDLKVEMDAGTFRNDLYYRLSALSFKLPPLCERSGDIPLLIAHFLEGSGKEIDPSVMKIMVQYNWPGNIRELDNEVKKMILMAGENEIITEEFVSPKLKSKYDADMPDPITADQIFENVEFNGSYSLYDFLGEHERRFIIKALSEKNGVKKHAAALLNIPESTLRLKIKQYGIDLKNLDSLH